ncbi:50S ribosomal protein L30 [Rickettsiales endosymbiont of Paramecium tredecaurelia]|uniref:50S ribosomal protein L30 n=1 Tax=Candidatus Sarmatiella mevalonica TaxID=2770581 RepID=UPI00192292B6|nr:50S ribosomal protein L30 [Candidatus Sarmatiella mevalonica]MBL3284434.1 50S ribosomal protein L30 [Candidatus Sarmatiella mevalonica]
MTKDQKQQLKVRQIGSAIGTKPFQRATLRALGLRKVGDENVLPNSQSVLGMLNAVHHLVSHETI